MTRRRFTTHALAKSATCRRRDGSAARTAVSTHALAKSATTAAWSTFASDRCFYPRAREERDRRTCPTPPRPATCFNPRAREERDVCHLRNLRRCANVSTHALAKSATLAARNRSYTCRVRFPTHGSAREERDRDTAFVHIKRTVFQPTRSRRARPEETLKSRTYEDCFNPRAREERDASLGHAEILSVMFQPTRSRRARPITSPSTSA